MTAPDRLLPYHDTTVTADGITQLRQRMLIFISGIRGERRNPVTEPQIILWFQATEADFVRARLAELCDRGEVCRCGTSLGSDRRSNGGYVYEVVKW